MLIHTSLLIIDDDPIHHKLVEFLIKQSSASIQYKGFLHASDALSYIVENNEFSTLPDLILLDLDMPYISGWGFLELFEAMCPQLAKPIDVIILTSSARFNEDKEKAFKYDCVKGFLSKPLTDDMLQDILNSSFISANRISKYFV